MEDYKKKYEDALERARRMCAMPIDKATMEYVFPELKDNDERIRKAIIAHMHIVKSVNGVDVSEILAWLEKVKDFDKQLEKAYKTADEVQYNRGYQDAMEEKAKFVDVILDFPTNFEREVSHFAASILNKEYDYTSAFIKISAKGLLESAKLELEKQYTIKDGNSIDPHFGKPITIAKMVNDFANGDLQPSLLEIDAYRRGISDTLEKQGEQSKEVTYTHEVETGNGNIKALVTEKVQLPKFKVGDWITNSIETVQITGYDIDYGYQVDCKGNLQHRDTDIIEKEYHLWTIQDAKDGDVLSYVTDEEDLWIMIYWSLYEPYEGHVHYHALLVNDNFTDKGTCCICVDDLKPATKEQRELLFKKMAENGYAWDSATKELGHQEVTKKSKQGNMSKMCPRCVQEQKPQGFSIIEIINQGNAKVAADMVESKYKELTHSQVTKKSDKVKWSDEDQDFFGLLEGYLEFDYTLSMKDKANTLDWLKSIKERLQ